jgi:hypothetical protein
MRSIHRQSEPDEPLLSLMNFHRIVCVPAPVIVQGPDSVQSLLPARQRNGSDTDFTDSHGLDHPASFINRQFLWIF